VNPWHSPASPAKRMTSLLVRVTNW
jgi:hypothetical protein